MDLFYNDVTFWLVYAGEVENDYFFNDDPRSNQNNAECRKDDDSED